MHKPISIFLSVDKATKLYSRGYSIPYNPSPRTNILRLTHFYKIEYKCKY